MIDRIENAKKAFDDIKDLFETPESIEYMKTIMTEDKVTSLLEEFSSCFINADPVKFDLVQKWKTLI